MSQWPSTRARQVLAPCFVLVGQSNGSPALLTAFLLGPTGLTMLSHSMIVKRSDQRCWRVLGAVAVSSLVWGVFWCRRPGPREEALPLAATANSRSPRRFAGALGDP